MNDTLRGEALRIHLMRCDGCPECAHVAPDGVLYAERFSRAGFAAVEARQHVPACPHLANDREDCWECFTDEHPAVQEQRLMDRYFGAQALGPGEDYEGREAR